MTPDPPPAKLPPLRQRVPLVLAELATLYPDPKCALRFRNPFELAIATILSAQCTDRRVNLVTPALFARFPDPHAVAGAGADEIETLIKSTGFFRAKAKSIRGFCEAVIRDHGGAVPGTLEELVRLPGVGRKTANVILGDAFGVPGITVDTHVGRLSRRLGWSKHADAVKVERDLMRLIPQPEWTRVSHRLILHGRQVCHARKPRCGDCSLAPLCPQRGVATPGSEVPRPKKRPSGP